MVNNKDNTQRLKNSYQPMVGDSYRPVPEASGQTKSFIPPAGGTGARTIEIKAVSFSASPSKK